MKLNKRQTDILNLVNQKQRVTVGFLAKALFFSEMTIRRDLTKMEHEGYLKRYHGGAVSMLQTGQYPIEQRMCINEKEKRNMAKCAEKYLCDNQTIFLPGCSTCAYLIPFLKNYKDLHIITNSVEFLTILSEMRIRCTICGGEYYATDKILVGREAENFLHSINYDIAFLSCDGIDADGTVSVEREDSAALVSISFENAKKRIIIADHSKLSTRYKYNVCNTADADDIIML